MYVKNEQLENVLIHSYVTEIIKEFSSSQNSKVSEDDAKIALSNLRSSSISIMKEHNLEIQQEEKYDNDSLNQNNFWSNFKQWLCPKIDENTERDQVAELVVNYVSNFVVGTIVIKHFLKILVFYVLQAGYNVTCRNI